MVDWLLSLSLDFFFIRLTWLVKEMVRCEQWIKTQTGPAGRTWKTGNRWQGRSGRDMTRPGNPTGIFRLNSAGWTVNQRPEPWPGLFRKIKKNQLRSAFSFCTTDGRWLRDVNVQLQLLPSSDLYMTMCAVSLDCAAASLFFFPSRVCLDLPPPFMCSVYPLQLGLPRAQKILSSFQNAPLLVSFSL